MSRRKGLCAHTSTVLAVLLLFEVYLVKLSVTALFVLPPSIHVKDSSTAVFSSSSFSDEPSSESSSTSSSTSSSLSPSSMVVIENVAEYCGVKPPTDYRSIPVVKRAARWTWRQRMNVLRVLHWRDPITPVDSCINLECLWWKVLSTTEPSSVCWEPEGYTYDLLPRPSRRIIQILRRFHPRWIHALLEIRMAYLNQAIANEMMEATGRKKTNVRVISLGAGYDVRSIRLLQESAQSTRRVECYEFDLPTTVESKRQIIQERLVKRQSKRRRTRRRQHETSNDEFLKLPTMIGLDLNNIAEFQEELTRIFSENDNHQGIEDDWHTIFVVEGVLMYLQDGNAAAVLQVCADQLREIQVQQEKSASASLCFADRLFDLSDCDPVTMQRQLAAVGWNLTEWAPNPTANAKHMGIARLETPQG